MSIFENLNGVQIMNCVTVIIMLCILFHFLSGKEKRRTSDILFIVLLLTVILSVLPDSILVSEKGIIMMNGLLKVIHDIGIVPVIAIDDAKKAVPLAKALIDGGLPAAEVTFRTEAAEEAIRSITAEVPEMLVGAVFDEGTKEEDNRGIMSIYMDDETGGITVRLIRKNC